GIRDKLVTGVQTCALPISLPTIALAKEKGTGATADLEATVKKIEQEILDGILKSDTSAIEKYLTSDYLGVGPDGATQNKSEFLRSEERRVGKEGSAWWGTE